ncbi:hypothetical protein ARMSODRAFT_977020 [Armillaria solidipes]|uniref:Uncharacterized protein n=1 Tax=Armillaria solidipes TaxID=1076256 RepID=A0A2H3B928_9AGAR|nr:hypothetical protein ARMSODRAFT_977020 [Armillaria solidipes]
MIWSGVETIYVVQVYCTHQMGGPIRSLGLHGSNKTLNQRLQSATHLEGIRCMRQSLHQWDNLRNIIESEAYAPALNTTTKSTQPIAAVLPDILVLLPSPLNQLSTETTSNNVPSCNGDEDSNEISLSSDAAEITWLLSKPQFTLPLLPLLHGKASHESVIVENLLYDKSKKSKKKLTAAYARHMTAKENLVALGKELWHMWMKEIFKDPVFKTHKAEYNEWKRQQTAAKKAHEKEEERRRKGC